MLEEHLVPSGRFITRAEREMAWMSVAQNDACAGRTLRYFEALFKHMRRCLGCVPVNAFGADQRGHGLL